MLSFLIATSDHTKPVCPDNYAIEQVSLKFQRVIFLSFPAEATILSSHTLQTVNKQSLCSLKLYKHSPVLVFHTLSVSSEDAEIILFPYYTEVKDIIKWVCPFNVLRICFEGISVIVIRSSPPPETSNYLSGIICNDYIYPLCVYSVHLFLSNLQINFSFS